MTEAQTSTFHRPLFGTGGYESNVRWAHSLWPKIIDRKDRMSQNLGLFKQ